MATGFRLEVASPSTSTTQAKTWEFTSSSQNVDEITCELKSEHHRISTLTAQINDPKWAAFSALPDPAFTNIPVRLYMGTAGNPQQVTRLVFEGKITQLEAGYPAIDRMVIIAHDNSIDARKQKRYRTFRNLTSVQVAQQIAQYYGYQVDTSQGLGDVTLAQRIIEMGAEVSDWDHVGRCLAGDGLEMYVSGNKMIIRQSSSTLYPTQLIRDQHPVIKLNVQINHIGGPGAGGDIKVAFDGGTKAAETALKGQEADKLKASSRTHRGPVGAADPSATGAHSEAHPGQRWTNKATQLRRRKDSATIVCQPLPDLGLQHQVDLEGWGGKVDGRWFIVDITHTLVPGSSGSFTKATLKRSPSAAGQSSAGLVAFDGGKAAATATAK